MKIVIYGLGRGGMAIEEALKSNHTIVGYTDSYSTITYFKSKRFYKLNELNQIEYDFIVIGIRQCSAYKEILNNIVENIKIDKSKILFFWNYFYRASPSRIDLILSQKIGYNSEYNAKHTSQDRCVDKIHDKILYDGVILGISHAAAGIDVNYLSKNFINLSKTRQDLFYNLMVFKHLINNYKSLTDNLQTVIIDLFDYVYFNFDLSMTEWIVRYIFNGGYNLDIHNFDKNPNIDSDITDWFPIYHTELTNDEKKLFNDLFDYDKIQYIKRQDILEKYNGKINVVHCDDNTYKEPKFTQKKYYKTINENLHYFDELMKIIFNTNLNMKVYTILMPRYCTIEERHKILYRQWKYEFEKIIKAFQKKYNFTYLNFKDCKEISENHNFYTDTSHLNSIGAIAFTSLLNQYIS